MQILRTAAAAAVAAAQMLSFGSRVTRSEPVLVTAVADGDTITVSTLGAVRLLGIDAPETSHGLDTAAPFGREARERLTRLVLRRWIRLEFDGRSRDVYSRHLAYVVTEDGQFINAVLVREGLARVSTREPIRRLAELKQAEAEAQLYRRGIWGSAPLIPSASYTPASGATRSPASKTKHPAKPRKKKRS